MRRTLNPNTATIGAAVLGAAFFIYGIFSQGF